MPVPHEEHLRVTMKHAVVLLIVVLLLSACSSPGSVPKQPQPEASLSGYWKDYFVEETLCDGAALALSTVELDLTRAGNLLTGSVTLTDLIEYVTIVGTFEGEVSGTTIKSRFEFIDRYGNKRSYQGALELSNNKLTGTLTDDLVQTCSDGTQEQWQFHLELIPRLSEPVNPDSLELNDSSGQAAALEMGKTYFLSLTPNDVDWLTFDLREPSVVTVSLELLSVLDFDIEFLTATDLETNGLEVQRNRGERILSLLPGKHYIHVGGYNNGFVTTHQENGLYSLKVEAVVAPDSALEPNDTKEQATKVALDFLQTNLYIGEGDVDWFTFTLTETKLFTSSITGNFVYRTLEDANGTCSAPIRNPPSCSRAPTSFGFTEVRVLTICQ